MRIEQHQNTISQEEAYRRGYYYILLTRTEFNGIFLPICNFLIGDSIVKFATPEDAEKHALEQGYDKSCYGYRISKVTVEEIKTVANIEMIKNTKAMQDLFEKAMKEVEKGAK